MLFHQLTQLDPDYYLVLITSEHFQRTFSNFLPPPHRRSVYQLHLPGPAAAADADAARPPSCSPAADAAPAASALLPQLAPAPGRPSAGRRRADVPAGLGFLGCWRTAAWIHSGSGSGPCLRDVYTGWLSGNDWTLSAHPNQTVCTRAVVA